MGADQKRFAVFSIRKAKRGSTIWVRAGSGIQNRDGSINVWLDVLPMDGQLHLRDAATVKLDAPPPTADVFPGAPSHPGCGGPLEFVAEIAAPGTGTSFRCSKCNAKVLRVRGAFHNAEDVEPSEIELKPWEVK
jgi:hypothetical protein